LGYLINATDNLLKVSMYHLCERETLVSFDAMNLSVPSVAVKNGHDEILSQLQEVSLSGPD
jgi:hypothetical protein